MFNILRTQFSILYYLAQDIFIPENSLADASILCTEQGGDNKKIFPSIVCVYAEFVIISPRNYSTDFAFHSPKRCKPVLRIRIKPVFLGHPDPDPLSTKRPL